MIIGVLGSLLAISVLGPVTRGIILACKLHKPWWIYLIIVILALTVLGPVIAVEILAREDEKHKKPQTHPPPGVDSGKQV